MTAKFRAKYNRIDAERRFAHIYAVVAGDRCQYCGMPNDGKFDHHPPVYLLHRFANGNLVTRRELKARFGACHLLPCCTICNMGLGAYYSADENDRRKEIVSWFLPHNQFPEDRFIFDFGQQLLTKHLQLRSNPDIYTFPGVGRAIYAHALTGFIGGQYASPADFPEWLMFAQTGLAHWLRGAPKRKSQYFLEMANLESYKLMPHARSDPRGQGTLFDGHSNDAPAPP